MHRHSRWSSNISCIISRYELMSKKCRLRKMFRFLSIAVTTAVVHFRELFVMQTHFTHSHINLNPDTYDCLTIQQSVKWGNVTDARHRAKEAIVFNTGRLYGNMEIKRRVFVNEQYYSLCGCVLLIIWSIIKLLRIRLKKYRNPCFHVFNVSCTTYLLIKSVII
jgi:hypothetical protein